MRILALLLALTAFTIAKDEAPAQAAMRTLRSLNGLVFERKGKVIEVVLNKNREITDNHLAWLIDLPDLTDVSLENTAIGDAGMAHLEGLKQLEWLNLYQTNVSDIGLTHLTQLPKVKLLPIGETKVTDVGLPALLGLKSLRYLGLRGNAITDRRAEDTRQDDFSNRTAPGCYANYGPRHH